MNTFRSLTHIILMSNYLSSLANKIIVKKKSQTMYRKHTVPVSSDLIIS